MDDDHDINIDIDVYLYNSDGNNIYVEYQENMLNSSDITHLKFGCKIYVPLSENIIPASVTHLKFHNSFNQ